MPRIPVQRVPSSLPKLTVPLFVETGNLVLSTGRPLNGGAAQDQSRATPTRFSKKKKCRPKEVKILALAQRNRSSCPGRIQNICQRGENWNHHAGPAKMA